MISPIRSAEPDPKPLTAPSSSAPSARDSSDGSASSSAASATTAPNARRERWGTKNEKSEPPMTLRHENKINSAIIRSDSAASAIAAGVSAYRPLHTAH